MTEPYDVTYHKPKLKKDQKGESCATSSPLVALPNPTPEADNIAELKPFDEAVLRRLQERASAKLAADNERREHEIDAKALAEINRLAGLDTVSYERERKAAANKLGMRASVLDEVVRTKQRERSGSDGLAGQKLDLPKTELWDEFVESEELIKQLRTAIHRHVIVSPAQALTVALWCVHTHAPAAAEHFPRLHLASPDKRCGKTKLLTIIANLAKSALPCESISPSAIFRTIELVHPTLLIDEADTFLTENPELRGLLNGGFERSGGVVRNVGDDFEPRRFALYGPVAISGIGNIPATIEDRSIRINMRRKLKSEAVERLNRNHHKAALHVLARKCARWANDHAALLAEADPELPSSLDDRSQDKWRPLLAIAVLCGEPVRREAFHAAIELSGGVDEDNLSGDVKLLGDILKIHEERRTSGLLKDEDHIPSAALVTALVGLEESPWATWSRGKPITQNKLATMLRKFGIRTEAAWISEKTVRAFKWSDFVDVWARYLESTI